MKRRITAIAVALVVAVIGAVAVISYANSADARAVAGQRVTDVFIAAKLVPRGTTARAAVDQGLISRQKVVAKGVPQGALTALTDDMNSDVTLGDIAPGSVVLTASFGAKSEVRTSTGVPDGKVAVSLSLSDPAGIAPLIRSGSHIAIYDTFNARKSSGPMAPDGARLRDDKESLRGTAVVLSDVPVLRVDGKPVTSSSDTGGGLPASGSSGEDLLVTVVVATRDATRLVHAIQTGDLYAGLLGNDTTVSPHATTNDNTVIKH